MCRTNLSHWRKVRLLVLAACSTFCLQARAEWGSIRANNRSEHQARGERQTRSAVPQQGREQTREGSGARERAYAPSVPVERGHEAERHFEEQAPERRHLDIDQDRRNGYFWSGISPGMFFGTLPSGYVPLNVGSTPYYYYGGAYYEQSPSGYVAVNPPAGAVVSSLPPGAEPLAAGPNEYYYAGGAFYLAGPQGYTVVPPPLGVTVDSLPPGATPVYVNGVQFYQYDGVYFEPVMQDGVVVYTTVRP